MHPPLSIHHHFPLQALNSFGIAAHAAAYLRVTSVADLAAVIGFSEAHALPRLILAGQQSAVYARLQWPGAAHVQ